MYAGVGVWYLSPYLRTPVSGLMYTIQQFFYCIQIFEADIFSKILYPNFRGWYIFENIVSKYSGLIFFENIVSKLRRLIFFQKYCIQIFGPDIFSKILYTRFRGWYFSVQFRYILRVSCCPPFGAAEPRVIFSFRQGPNEIGPTLDQTLTPRPKKIQQKYLNDLASVSWSSKALTDTEKSF